MSLLSRKCWLQRAFAIAVTALGFYALAPSTKPAEAAFVSIGVGPPGYYNAPWPACSYYYPYGCYGYAAPYYAPAAIVASGWGGWGWGAPCWGCGRFFPHRHFFHDGRFFRDGRFFHDGRFFRDGRFFHGGFFHGGFHGPAMMHGGFGGGRR